MNLDITKEITIHTYPTLSIQVWDEDEFIIKEITVQQAYHMAAVLTRFAGKQEDEGS